MESLDFRRVPEQLAEAVEFLRRHVKGRVKTKGSHIELEGVSHKEAKLLMHKFLKHMGLHEYRVLSQTGTLVVVPPHPSEPSKREAGPSPPPASATMPYFFPGTPGPVPTEKRIRKRKD